MTTANEIQRNRQSLDEDEFFTDKYSCLEGRGEKWEPIECNDNCKYPKLFDGLCGVNYRNKYHLTLHEAEGI